MRKPYWTLNHATEGIGRQYPQHQEMSAGYDYDAYNSVHRLPFGALPNFEPNFDTVIIHGHARLTDLLSSAPIRATGFLLSDRLRVVLGQFSLPPHRFYPVPIIYRRKPVEGYYWLQLVVPPPPIPENASVEVLEAMIVSDPRLVSLDMLRWYGTNPFVNSLVSDPLRLAMESAKITGVRFGTSKLFRQFSAGRPT